MSLRPALAALVALAALAGACGVAQAALPAPGACPATPRQWLERPIAADCLDCWRAAEQVGRHTLTLDWIVPTTAEAELAVAALPEATERFGERPQRRVQPLPRPPAGVRLRVDSGLAWHGYVALTFELRRAGRSAVPADARGWVALVERVAAGQDGSGSERRLVRALAGPLTLPPAADGTPLQHVVAVRLPPNARAERLGAVGWIERADGAVWTAAESVRPGCNPASR